jgi:hypothetical protein
MWGIYVATNMSSLRDFKTTNINKKQDVFFVIQSGFKTIKTNKIDPSTRIPKG